MVCAELSLPEQALSAASNFPECLPLTWADSGLGGSVGLMGPGAPPWRCRLFPEGRANHISTAPWKRDAPGGESSLLRFQGPTSKGLRGPAGCSPGMLWAGRRVRGDEPPPTRAALGSGCEVSRGRGKFPPPV